MLLEISGEIPPEKETEPKQKQHTVVDVSGGESKVQRSKQYHIRT